MKHLETFAQFSHYQKSAGLGRLWVFGQHPEEAPQLPAQPTLSTCVVPSSFCFLTPLPILVWLSAA